MRNIQKIAIITIIMALASCMVGPDFHKIKVDEPEVFRFDKIRTDSMVDLEWWNLVHDNALKTLIDSALENNNDVRIAASRVEEARIYLGFTKADMYPEFGYSGGASYGNSLGGIPSGSTVGAFSATANLTWEIDFWGKFRRSNEAAKADLLASEYGKRMVQVGVITSVADAYFMLLDYRQRLEVAERTLESRTESLRIINERFEKGIVPEIDVNQSQIQKATAEVAIPGYERLIAYAENALSVLVGDNPRTIAIDKKLNEQVTGVVIPVGLPSELLKRRPDVLAAEQQVIAQNAKIGVAQAMRFPSISLTGMVGMASPDLSSFNAADALMGSVGAGLFGPIFNFGKNKRRVEMEEERTKQTKYNYEQVVINAFRETEDALINISAVNREVEITGTQKGAAENAAKLSMERYNGGVTSYLEVLETERSLFQIELYYSELQQRRLSAYTNLYKVLGGGWATEAEKTQTNP